MLCVVSVQNSKICWGNIHKRIIILCVHKEILCFCSSHLNKLQAKVSKLCYLFWCKWHTHTHKTSWHFQPFSYQYHIEFKQIRFDIVQPSPFYIHVTMKNDDSKLIKYLIHIWVLANCSNIYKLYMSKKCQKYTKKIPKIYVCNL